MQHIYKFSIPKLTEVEEVTENEDGSKTIKKVKKEINVPFLIKKTSYSDTQEKQFFYTKKYNEYLNAGILPEILLRKIYANANGIFTNDDKREWDELCLDFGRNLSKIKEIESKENLTDEDKKEIDQINSKNKEIKEKILSYETIKNSVFDNSAEALSHDQTIFWCLLKLLYKEDQDSVSPVFEGKDHEDRIRSYERIAEIIEKENDESAFYSRLIERASFLTSLYYMNPFVKPAEFSDLLEAFDNPQKDESKE